jgi:hypothetical protein
VLQKDVSAVLLMNRISADKRLLSTVLFLLRDSLPQDNVDQYKSHINSNYISLKSSRSARFYYITNSVSK